MVTEAPAAQDPVARLISLLTPRLPSYIPHVPEPKQAAFLLLDCLEAMYGGAAGGGKSDALLMGALQYVDVSGYAALILRRDYRRLAMPGGLLPRSQEWLAGSDARWVEEDKTWHFPSGATVTFGHLESENDKYRYQSSEIQYCAFDELTDFSESQYRFLFSRLRRLKSSPVPIRMRAASNPGGPGHEWVKQRFLVEGKAAGRIFLPAKLADNPHLDRDEYIRSLSELDPVLRQQLLEGDWSARSGGSIFRREWFGVAEAVPREVTRVRYWDLAATAPKPGADPDWTAGCRMARDPQGIYYIEDLTRLRGTPGDIEGVIVQVAALDGPTVPIRFEQERGAAGINLIDHYRRHALPSYAVKGVPVTGEKAVRAGPLASQAEAGNVKVIRGPWVGAFLDEVEGFPAGAHDDQVDAAAGAYLTLAAGAGARYREHAGPRMV